MKRASTEESPKTEVKEEVATTETTNKSKGYWRVRFHERSDETQPEDISISVNGETLVIRRGVTTILPESFLEVAKNATIISMKYDPIKNVTTPRIINKLPFYVEGEATREEYLALKLEGTKKTKEEIKRKESSGS